MRFLSLFAFVLTALPYYAYSYCVYNKHSDDTLLFARQYGGGSRAFRQKIYPGYRACCPYTEPTCNVLGGPNSIVKLWIERAGWDGVGVGHFSVTLPAGGWVAVDGYRMSHTVAVYCADGRVYKETKIEYGAQWHAKLNETRTANLEEQQHQLQNKAQLHQSQNTTQLQSQNKTRTHEGGS